MKSLVTCLTVVSIISAAHAAPAFRDTGTPAGWTVLRGVAATGSVVQQAGGKGTLQLNAAEAVSLPVEATFRFRAGAGDDLTFEAMTTETNPVPSLLRGFFRLSGPNQALVMAQASGKPMATDTISTRTWSQVEKRNGSLSYGWRFPMVKNLWDETDRREIGAAYAQLVPFTDKVFVLRLVLTATTRQIWLDDRLVAEERVANPPQVRFSIQVERTAQVLSADFRAPEETGAYIPLVLTSYSHDRIVAGTSPVCELARLSGPVPMWVPKTPTPDIDLGQSLYRYRLTHGSGPNAGYVNALVTWPAAFAVDPASLTFRVPYRHYENVWLLAWLDDRPNAVPRGALRFFREEAGYPASTDFEISDTAMKKGLVTKLPQQTAAGKTLYLVKVPVDTDGLYGLRDLADQFLDFELTKPLALVRSYPDPIYYGYHPGGWPSAVHVVGITLEEAPFGYEVQAAQTGHVFERPNKPSYVVTVANTTDKPLSARIAIRTRSYDGAEEGGDRGRVTVPAHGAGVVKLDFGLKKLGWHEVKVEVEANGQKRGNTLALVVLPPNTRTYGNAPNETRFGTWSLLGHYVPMEVNPASPTNDALLAMFHELGLRRFSLHGSFVSADMLKRHDFLPNGPHTVGNAFAKTVAPDGTVNVEEMQKAVSGEVAQVAKDFPETTYFYGGEWHIGKEVQYAPWPRYTGDGDRDLTAEERANAERHIKIFTAIGKGIREQGPGTKLILQWGAPIGSIAYLRAGMPRELVDMFGMDAPQFEQLPEVSNLTGSMNQLWSLRQEAQKLGWPRLPIAWCEGPFFPTMPGALTETEQAEYQIRYWLLGLAYGIEQFQAGVVPHDAGNYYGAEHYGAGLFHRRPLEHPKPAVAAVATATAMLCGSDPTGGIDTGCLTTYCLGFQRAKDKSKFYALWRVNGTVEAAIKVRGAKPVIIDAMGNATPCRVTKGEIKVTISTLPVWLTGADQIEGFAFAPPQYSEVPARITRPLAEMTAERWVCDTNEDRAYAYNHFAVRRIPDPNLQAEFGQGETGHADAAAITLPVEPDSRPLATRYSQLKLRQPVTIPGKASALGLWIKGNSSWGRVVYQCRDAKGEIWTSVGTKDDWNCDDNHAWSYISFEGWRYVRFPLPGNQPYDCARDLEITWWGSHGGAPSTDSTSSRQAGSGRDGIVDLPLTLEKIIVEARNEVPVLGEMKLVPARSYKLSGLVAEYDTEENTTEKVVAANKVRMPLPEWTGPAENPIARLTADGVGAAPAIKEFVEPQHFNDGRNMVIHFAQDPAQTYNLYLGRYPDGRGAELLTRGVKDGQTIGGLRPETTMYLFLTAVSADKKESKPSAALALVTHDNFAEK